jgi:hypothetical protein
MRRLIYSSTGHTEDGDAPNLGSSVCIYPFMCHQDYSLLLLRKPNKFCPSILDDDWRYPIRLIGSSVQLASCSIVAESA